MHVFEKVQEAIRPQAQDDHARRNKENEVSLKKANKGKQRDPEDARARQIKPYK